MNVDILCHFHAVDQEIDSRLFARLARQGDQRQQRQHERQPDEVGF